MVKKKVGKKAAPKRNAAPKKKAAPKRNAAPKKKAAPKRNAAPKTSGLDDTFQNWVNQQVAVLNKKKR
ncbi:MAG: hypothetical protein MK229_03220 [Nitrososphaerales archaeon]|nr:hypothetical protein [Nitrososphaerales archaeon]